MSKPIAKRQMFGYDIDNPSHIYCVPYPKSENVSLLPNHWRKELETVYTLQRHSIHYIDRVCIRSKPGRLIMANSESAYNTAPGREVYGDGEKVVIVLVASRGFLETVFPDFKSVYFLNERETAHLETGTLMLELSRFHSSVELSTYEKIYVRGLVSQLLYHIT